MPATVAYRWFAPTDVHGEPFEMSTMKELKNLLLAQFRIESQQQMHRHLKFVLKTLRKENARRLSPPH